MLWAGSSMDKARQIFQGKARIDQRRDKVSDESEATNIRVAQSSERGQTDGARNFIGIVIEGSRISVTEIRAPA
jgi:hypothetical protein